MDSFLGGRCHDGTLTPKPDVPCLTAKSLRIMCLARFYRCKKVILPTKMSAFLVFIISNNLLLILALQKQIALSLFVLPVDQEFFIPFLVNVQVNIIRLRVRENLNLLWKEFSSAGLLIPEFGGGKTIKVHGFGKTTSIFMWAQ